MAAEIIGGIDYAKIAEKLREELRGELKGIPSPPMLRFHPNNPVLHKLDTEAGISGPFVLDMKFQELFGKKPLARYYMFFSSTNAAKTKTEIHLALSNDGVNWRRYGKNPILTPTEDWEGEVCHMPTVIGGVMFYRAGGAATAEGNVTGRAETEDWLTWTTKAKVFDSPYTGIEAEGPVGDWHLIYAKRETLRGVEAVRACYAKSTDKGKTWTDYGPTLKITFPGRLQAYRDWFVLPDNAHLKKYHYRFAFTKDPYRKSWVRPDIAVVAPQDGMGFPDSITHMHMLLTHDEQPRLYFVNDVYGDIGLGWLDERYLSPDTLPSGVPYSCPLFWEALDIRDTETYTSDGVGYFRGDGKCLVSCFNTLDQDVTVEVEGSADMPFAWSYGTLGSSFTVGAGKNVYQVITDPVPWIRVKVKAGTAPSKGAFSAELKVV